MADINDYINIIPSENNEKPKFVAMNESILGAFVDTNNVINTLIEKFDLDIAVGIQLDIIGQWVGITRYINQVLLVQFFGFEDNVAALPFGEEGNLAIGGRFYNEGESYVESSILADPEYRLLLRAKIVKNQAKSTISDAISALNFIFPDTVSSIYDNGNMSFNVGIGRPLTLTEIAIITNLDIIPRPAGVRINTISYYSNNYLGFSDQIGFTGFAEEGELTHGFLAEEI